MSELLILGHLGLGDQIICNALVRHHAAQHTQTVVLCKHHNQHTLCFQWRDDPKIEVFSVTNDDEARECLKLAKQQGFKTLALGCHAPELPFDVQHWDSEFYRQADVPFQDRWNKFCVSQQPSREVPIPKKPFALVHDDPKRGFSIREELLPKHLKIVRVDPSFTPNLYDWWTHIQKAEELHLMESSVAILADSLPDVGAKRKVIHHYTRPSIAPTYRQAWEHIT